MTPTTEHLTIRAMCAAFDVTARTLRFYEAKELIFPRREGTKRLYSRADRARLTLILRGKRFGFSLEDIRQLLAMYDRDGSNLAQLERTYDLAAERLLRMQEQRRDLDLAIAELTAQMTEGAVLLSRLKSATAA